MSRLRLATLACCLASVTLTPTPARASGPPGGLEARAWEMVSPVEKNGGEVGAPGTEAAGTLQAAVGGSALAFGAAASFGEGEGAPPISQYLASRGVGAWATQNISPALLPETYGGGAYQLFSEDLSRAILTNGWSCPDGKESCEAENPPLGEGAPAGYRNLYVRESTSYQPVITTANSPALTVPAEDFSLSLEGAGPDLRHLVVSTCAALTADAVEVPSGEGCEASADNLYEWSEGQLQVLNKLPGFPVSAPGASLAAPSSASADGGARVYWTRAGNLYLREGEATQLVSEGGAFQTASADGSLAFFTKAGHLYRYSAVGAEAVDLTPAGGVNGVLGASRDGTHVYYLTTAGLYLWEEGGARKVAAGADESNYPPATGTARVSADGNRLAFQSAAPLVVYDNSDFFSGKPDMEVYVYDAAANGGAGALACASCHSTASLPIGPSTLPAARAAGGGPPAYKPRALSEDGRHLFFDSRDSLVSADSDNHPDVYEWVAAGTGGCATPSGCIGLISDGRDAGGTFADASASGADVYFATATSIARKDVGGLDLYDARAGGGFLEPEPPAPCEGDDCQGPAPAPEDATPGTATLVGPTNPPVKFGKHRHRRRHHHRRHHRHHRGGRK